MKTYIALLRGINVSGKNLIKMDHLKVQLQKMGFVSVNTYIQSGNIVFSSDITDHKVLESEIEQMIEKKFGFQVPVWVRTLNEFIQIREQNPYIDNSNIDISKFHVTLLSGIPDSSLVEKMENIEKSDDEFILNQNTIYLYCKTGYGKTKLNNNFFEKKLKVIATTRNWKTVCKLIDLATSYK